MTAKKIVCLIALVLFLVGVTSPTLAQTSEQINGDQEWEVNENYVIEFGTINPFTTGSSPRVSVVLSPNQSGLNAAATQVYMAGEVSGDPDIVAETEIVVEGFQGYWITFHRTGENSRFFTAPVVDLYCYALLPTSPTPSSVPSLSCPDELLGTLLG